MSDRGIQPLGADHSLRVALSLALVVGVSVSAILLAVGLAAGLLAGWQTSLIGGARGSGSLTDLAGLLPRLAAVQPLAIAQLGLLVLLATPVLRVATAVVAFAVERDGLYVAVSLAVLAILLASILFVR